jgi:uncharacterized LabA/DUF88 family protein
MSRALSRSGLKAGLYIDVSNLTQNGGFGMRFEVLREFACRENAEAVRLNAYVSFDDKRAQEDSGYRYRQYGFHSKLRDHGYKVIVKQVKWYTDENGEVTKKSNVDLDLAVDALLQSENLDRVVLATGDGDFVQVVRALQNRGCRVEVVAFDNVSGDLRREADLFTSGYLIPELLPIKNARGGPAWGEIGSRVRGYCYFRDPQDKPFGFLRYLRSIDGDLFRIDARHEESPYGSIFCHDSEMPQTIVPASDLPSRDVVLEFTIGEDSEKKRRQAIEVEWINPQN